MVASPPTVPVAFAAYALGALMGVAADRGGPRVRQRWPVYLRVQFLATAGLLTMFSAWRLSTPAEVVAPVLMAGTGGVLVFVSWVTRGDRSAGQSVLEGWAAFPNGTFWVLPVAGALAGPAATVVIALANALYAAPNAVSIHLMRRDAPVAQRRSTTWVDQSALVAFVLGLSLHIAGPAPTASRWVLDASGPLMAFVGAALYVGSVLHPHNIAVGRDAAGTRRWSWLCAVRVTLLLALVAVSHTRSIQVVAALSALGAPAFNPPQLAVLYGYRSGAVNASAHWGWLLLPFGFALAVWLR